MKTYMEREKEEINVDRDDYPKVETKTIEGRDRLTAELRRPGGLPFWETVELTRGGAVEGLDYTSIIAHIGTEDLDALIDLLTAVQAEVKGA